MDIRAPLSGLIVPLDAVPDEVFARKIVGDGVAIDPTSNEVLAPITGRVTQLHRAHHALAITDDNGVEILIHVGLDTVKLDGQGLTPLVALGAHVECGQPVLRFDADRIACAGYTLLTPVIVTSGERIASMQRAQGLVEAGRTTLLSVELHDAVEVIAVPTVETRDMLSSDPITLPDPDGLHARPAAVLAEHARKFAAEIRLLRGNDVANAKSAVAIMGLSTRAGDVVRIEASGADAVMAIAELSHLVSEGCGVRTTEAPPVVSATLAVATRDELAGIAASPGIAIGRIFQHRRNVLAFDELGAGQTIERARLTDALRAAALQLAVLERGIEDRSRAQILAMHRSLLEDPELIERAESHIAQGKSAAFAWSEACSNQAAKLEQLEVPLLRERAADVRDVGRRVLTLLTGVKAERVTLPDSAIVIAEELAPSELAALERDKLAGLCTTTGSSTSHVAIVARSMGIPAICGIDAAALALSEGRNVVLDGTRGVLQVNPDEITLARARERMVRDAQQRAADRAASKALACTRDGKRIEVVANIRNLDDARAALAEGAEGVGLLRTEFLFERNTPPSEEEQATAYSAIAQLISQSGKDRPVVIRTLDAGGDKPLTYLPMAKESNPFLGVRGIRVSLERPDLFRAQLRAILRAATMGNVHIMFPMVSGLEEVRAARKILAEEQRTLPAKVSVGIMIEVPSAALMAEALAREVDFFSIGTNDLTQYTLAMDRGHPLLARQADALHPAVLRMMAMTVEGARKHGRWVGVCGGIASDPLAVPVLVGLGISELSVDVRAVAPVKAALARITLAECQAIAAEVLTLATTAEVRALLQARAIAGGSS